MSGLSLFCCLPYRSELCLKNPLIFLDLDLNLIHKKLSEREMFPKKEKHRHAPSIDGACVLGEGVVHKTRFNF